MNALHCWHLLRVRGRGWTRVRNQHQASFQLNILQLYKWSIYLPNLPFPANGTFSVEAVLPSAQLLLSWPSSVLMSCLSDWQRVACSLSEFQPSPKCNGFKLWTFDFDSVSTLSSCGPTGPLSELDGHADPCQSWFLGKGRVYYESLLHHPQNKRWDHVWGEWFLKTLGWWRVILN